MFDSSLLLLLDGCLPLHMMNQQIGRIVKDRFIFVRKY